MDRGRCLTCGEEIVWAKHERTGKRMPLEDTRERGRFVMREDGETYEAAPTLYVSHFANCPQARFWKGRTRS